MSDAAPSPWAYLDRVDPFSSNLRSNMAFLKRVSTQFVRSYQFDFKSDSQRDTLLHILQMIIRSLAADNSERGHTIRALHKKLAATADEQTKVRAVAVDRCPVCGQGFRTIQYLDQHVFRRHQEAAELWQLLRTPQLPGRRVALPEATSDRRQRPVGSRTSPEMVTDLRRQIEDVEQRMLEICREQSARIAGLERRLQDELSGRASPPPSFPANPIVPPQPPAPPAQTHEPKPPGQIQSEPPPDEASSSKPSSGSSRSPLSSVITIPPEPQFEPHAPIVAHAAEEEEEEEIPGQYDEPRVLVSMQPVREPEPPPIEEEKEEDGEDSHGRDWYHAIPPPGGSRLRMSNPEVMAPQDEPGRHLEFSDDDDRELSVGEIPDPETGARWTGPAAQGPMASGDAYYFTDFNADGLDLP
jgi:hypothetical protein